MGPIRSLLWLVAAAGFFPAPGACPDALGAVDAGSEASLLARPTTPHLRVMTWNVGTNSIFDDPGPRGTRGSDAARPARFRRMLQAIQPDILCLQEVFPPRNADDVAQLLDATLPLAGDDRWQAYGAPDVVIAARYPIATRDSRSEDWGGGVPRTHAMAGLELPGSAGGVDLHIICAHMQSGGAPKDLAARQAQADAIVAWTRELRNSRQAIDATALVVLGDMNAYETDPARHVESLISGQIVNVDRFGAAAPPHTDGLPLCDAQPRHNVSGTETYTFGDGSSARFPPAAVDRILFTASRLRMLGGFVLNTTTLGAEALMRAGLQADDVRRASGPEGIDHLPLVVDFALEPSQACASAVAFTATAGALGAQ
jgi:endonuclease/exonuclease/phosphatase family metal-dependent hydrolase